jgi:hypothetical protein
VGTQDGTTTKKLPGGGLAVGSAGRPESVHIAYPGVD